MALPHEQTVNVYLAEILERHFQGQAEVIAEKRIAKGRMRRRFDIKIYFRGIEFILEASYDEKDAEKDAMKRLEEGLIDTVAIAIHYEPSKFEGAETAKQIKRVLIENPLKLKVFTQGRDISGTLLEFITQSKRGKPKSVGGWMYIDINEFGTFFESIIELVVKEDILNDLLEQIEEKTVNFVNIVLRELSNPKFKASFLRDLNLILFSPASKEEIEVPEVPDEVLLSHAYISLLMASTLYESVSKEHGLRSLKRLMVKHNDHPLKAMEEGFTEILKIDYENVFDVALGVIRAFFDFSDSMPVMEAFTDLIDYVSEIVKNKALLRQDFIGHIYHKVTGDIATRKGYATFYTKSPIATFLANLALNSPNDAWNFDWSDLKTFRLFKTCDFACGSGTLLSATYSGLLSKYWKSSEEPLLDKFHKILIEESIWGFDALEHAVQTASVVLSLHEPSIPLEKMNTYHIPVDESGSLGSLNMWNANTFLLPLKRRSIGKTTKATVYVPRFEFIIMNPPFSRTTAPGEAGSRPRIFDFVVSEKGYRNLWEKYKEVIESMKEELLKRDSVSAIYEKYVGQGKVFLPQNVNPINAGAAWPFIVLADRYLKPHGRMALVLPKTVIESSAFFLVRALMVANYEIEYIIVSEEPGNYNFSYSTQLSEVLLVLKKLKKGEKPHENTTIIKFQKQPRNNLEGVLMAKAVVTKKPTEGVSEIKILNAEATIYNVSRRTMEDFVWNWSILTDLPLGMIEFLNELLGGKILGYNTDITKFGEIQSLLKLRYITRFKGGSKKFKEKFRLVSEKTKFAFLGKAGKDVLSYLKLQEGTLEHLLPNNAEAIKFYETHSGRLLIPEAFRFNSSGLISVWSERPVISTRLHALISPDPKVEKALCAWINSTFAITYLRALFTTVEGNFGHIYGWHLRTLPVPDLTNKRIVANLAEVFEKYKQATWKPLPKQYEGVIDGTDLTREQYDLDVLRAITGEEIEEEDVEIELLELYLNLLKMLR